MNGSTHAAEPFDSDDRAARHRHACARSCRPSVHPRDAARAAVGRPVRVDPERRDGLGGRLDGRPGVPDPLDARRDPRRGRTPIALGYHTGHWEVGLLMEAAARVQGGRRDSVCGGVHRSVRRPFAGHARDVRQPAYRNDAATVFRRLIRIAADTARVLGVATCDKGLPAMMMALASSHDLPCAGAWRRHAAAGSGRRCRADPDHRRPLRARRDHAAGGADLGCRACVAWRRVPVPRHRRNVGGRAKRSGCRWGIRRSHLPDIRSGSTWPRDRRPR